MPCFSPSLGGVARGQPPAPVCFRLTGLTLTAKALYSVLLHQTTGRPQLIVVDGNNQADALFPLPQAHSPG